MGYQDEGGSGFMWFLAGMTVGAVVALLYAPYRGRDMRRLVSKKAEEAREFVSETGQEIYDRGRGLVDEASELVERGRKYANKYAKG